MPRKKSRIYETLKPAHLQAIGRVAAEWSGLEFMFQSLISTVAGFDSFKCVILTKAANIHDWKVMLHTLVLLEYKDSVADQKLTRLYRKISDLQGERNSIVHTHWNQKQIETGLLKGTPLPPGEIVSGLGLPKRGRKVFISVDKTAAEMRHVAKNIEKAKIELYEIVRQARQRASQRKLLAAALLATPNQGQPNLGTPDAPLAPLQV